MFIDTLLYTGYGRSWSKAPPEFRFDAASHISQLRALLAELEVQPSFLVAHSAGATIAMLFAEETASVRALVLMAPAGAMDSPVPCFSGLQACLGACGLLGVAVTEALMSGSVEDYSLAGSDSHAAQLAEWDGAWQAASTHANTKRALAASALRLPLVNLSLGPSLKQRGVRALVLTAADDKQVRGVKDDFYRSAFGNGASIATPFKSGHCFFIQEADAVHLSVLAFLGS